MLKQGPTLRTLIMVEDTLKNADDSVVTVAQLKKLLPKQVHHTALMEILEYLEEKNIIVTGVKGITWLTPMTKEFREHWGGGRKL
ncbi:MAG: hypothetical protein OXR66_03255 [Candidatus Woesearchaeota archaeon]|nr:hypothetical protein [Candidatus Woesearchaeota archaeon]